jgi:polysaccharide pyruvyl transferase WcaK-like protein
MREVAAPRVGLVGAFGGENLGNDASAAALIRGLREVGAVRPVLVSGLPAATLFGPDVESIVLGTARPSRSRWVTAVRRLFHVAAAPAMLDSVVVAGGGMFEAEGTRGADSVFGALALLVLAASTRLRGKPFALHAVGGTIVSGRARRTLVGWTGRLATRRSFRDTESRDALVRMHGARPTDPVVPDVAFVLAPDLGDRRPDRSVGAERCVVVGVMGYAWLRDPDLARAYESALVELVRYLLEDARVRVEVVCGDVADRIVATHLQEVVGPAGGRVSQPAIADFAELVEHMRACDLAVCSRFHNVVAAVVAGTPVVAVTDRAKVWSLMSAAGLGDYVLDARSVTPSGLVGVVDRLDTNAAEVVDALRELSALSRAEAERDVAELARHLRLPPLASST